MQKHHTLFCIILFLSGAFSLIGAPVLVGVNESGDSLKYGSGSDKAQTFYSAPLVDDTGTVAFVYTHPDATSELTEIAASTANFLTLPVKSNLLFDYYFQSVYEIMHAFDPSVTEADYAWTNTRLLFGADGAIFALRKQYFGNQDPDIYFASEETSIKLDFPDLTPRAYVVASGNGSKLAVCDNNGKIILVDLNNDTAAQIPGLQTDKKQFALSCAGDVVYFSKTNPSHPSGTVTEVYAFEISSQTTTLIADAILPKSNSASLAPQVAAARATEAIAFASNNDTLIAKAQTTEEYFPGYGAQIIVAQLADGKWETECCSAGAWLFNCKEPTLSADGKMVFFTAQKTTSSSREVWRFDRVKKKLEQLTTAGMDCLVPAVSPSGRHLAFVTESKPIGYDGSENYANVYALDLGPSIHTSRVITTVSSAPAPLPLSFSGTTANASFTLAWKDSLPGTITTANGTPVTSGTQMSIPDLPLTFTPASNGQCTITVELVDGAFVLFDTLSITVREEGMLELKHISATPAWGIFPMGGTPRSDFSFSLNDAGTLVAFNCKSSENSDQTLQKGVIYLHDLSLGTITLIPKMDESHDPIFLALSGDGTTLFYIHAYSSKLYRIDLATQTAELFMEGIDEASYAVSYDATALLYFKDDHPYYCSNGQESCISETLTACSTPMLSRDGLRAAFLSGTDLHVWDAITQTLTPLAQNVTECAAVSSLGRFFVIQQNAAKWIDLNGDETEITLSALPDIPLSQLHGITLSANGTVLAYGRPLSKSYQAFHYDLLTNKELAASISDSGAYSSAGVTYTSIALNGDGSRLFFVSASNNLLDGKTGTENKNDIFMAQFESPDNSAPTIAGAPESIQEGTPLAAYPFIFSDDDPGDAGELLYSITSTDGEWQFENGEKVTFPISVSRLGITFVAADTDASTVTATITVYDTHGEQSAQYPFTIRLSNVSGLWGDLSTGQWVMLATPYEVRSADLAAALGCDELWTYQNGTYGLAPETLSTGQGFAAFIASQPDATFHLAPVLTAPAPLQPGWNLVGADAAPEQAPLYQMHDQSYIKLDTLPDLSTPWRNWAVWAFIP